MHVTCEWEYELAVDLLGGVSVYFTAAIILPSKNAASLQYLTISLESFLEVSPGSVPGYP